MKKHGYPGARNLENYSSKNSIRFAGIVHKACGNGAHSSNINMTRMTKTLVYTIDNFDCNSAYNYLTVQAVASEGQTEASCNLVSKSIEVVQ